MQYILKIIEGSEKGLIFTLNEGELVVGRDPGCDIILSDSKVSRRHARFRRAGPDYFIEDLQSANGTLVNGEEISSLKLEEGNIVIIGKNSFHFVAATSSDLAPAGDDANGHSKTITIDTGSLLSRWPADESEDALIRAKSDLEALYRIGQIAGSILESPQLIRKMLDIIFQEVAGVERSSIHLMKETGNGLKCVAFRAGDIFQPPGEAPLSRTIARTVAITRRAVLTNNAMDDQRFMEGESIQTQKIRSAICAPLLSEDKLNGMIYVDVLDPDKQFSSDDLRLVAAIGLQMGAQLENARLYERLGQEKEALEQANQQVKSAQQELIQSEKLAAVGRLSSGIVHDIKTPLSVVLGYTGLMKNHVGKIDPNLVESAKIDECISEIENAISHCNKMIQDMLQFARPADPEKKTLNINKIVEDTLQFLQVEFNKSSVSLQVDFSEGIPPVMADENQLKQVVINIVMNALQAMDKKKKTLSVRTEKVEISSDPKVCIHVTDNGKGMTEDERRKIFEPFYTTKHVSEGEGGSGLGLSVSYGLIHSHGGHIEVESQPGEGTTFTVSLPVGVG